MANSGSFNKRRQPLRHSGRPEDALSKSTRNVRLAIAEPKSKDRNQS
jgi:hypothetical protein